MEFRKRRKGYYLPRPFEGNLSQQKRGARNQLFNWERHWNPKIRILFYRDERGAWVELDPPLTKDQPSMPLINRPPLHMLLQEQRHKLKIKLSELSQKSGIDAATLSRLLKGRRKMSLKLAHKIATALQLDPAMLLSYPPAEAEEGPLDPRILWGKDT